VKEETSSFRIRLEGPMFREMLRVAAGLNDTLNYDYHTPFIGLLAVTTARETYCFFSLKHYCHHTMIYRKRWLRHLR